MLRHCLHPKRELGGRHVCGEQVTCRYLLEVLQLLGALPLDLALVLWHQSSMCAAATIAVAGIKQCMPMGPPGLYCVCHHHMPDSVEQTTFLTL